MIIGEKDTLFLVLYFLANGIRIYTVFRFMCMFFNRSESNKLLEVFWFTLYLVTNSVGFVFLRSMPVNLATNILLCFIISCLYPGGITSRLLVTGLIYGINIIWDAAIGATFFPTGNYFLTTGMFTSVCVFATEIVFERFQILKASLDNQLVGKWKLLFVVPTTSIFLAALNYILAFGNRIVIINLVGLLVIDFVIFYIYAYLQKESRDLREKELLKEQNQSYRHQFHLMEDSIEDLNHFKHDIKKHMNIILVMLQEGRMEHAVHYLGEMSDVINPKWGVVSTGNRDIDCILNYKLSKAVETGIEIKKTIAVPKALNVKAFDLNIILTNLWDNAIEAVMECEKKEIVFEMRLIDNGIYIYIKNPYQGNIVKKGDTFVTSKKDKEIHGYGIESVKKVVKKYKGNSSFEYEANVFEATIYLVIPDKAM